MKYFSFFILLLSSYAVTCPNMCSGHGSCSNGVCLCSFGFTGGDCNKRLCPRDVPYADPNGELGIGKRTYLECSGQGKCDRTTGLCQCFAGYEGGACQRQKCPNNCNGHGVCTPVNLLKLEDRVIEDAYYDKGYWNLDGSKWEAKDYSYWDKDHSFSCVCDKEWTGFDCNQRKCPTGYTSVSDCDSPPQTEQTIEYTTGKIENSKTFYIEYTDPLGGVWYTDLITGKDTAAKTAAAIKDALLKLPPGVIDLESVEANTAGDTITVKFGEHQTGKQAPMRIIGKEAFTATGEFGLQEKAPGYHGMYADTTTPAGATLDIGPTPFTVVGGIEPLVCSGNGKCNTEEGVCECFDDYYGNACTKQKEML